MSDNYILINRNIFSRYDAFSRSEIEKYSKRFTHSLNDVSIQLHHQAFCFLFMMDYIKVLYNYIVLIGMV